MKTIFYVLSFFALNAWAEFSAGQMIPENVGVSQPIEGGKIANVQIVDNRLHVYLLDDKRVVLKPDYTSGSLRYKYFSGHNKDRQFITTLNLQGDGFTAERILQPPHKFFIYIQLHKQGGESLSLSRIRYEHD
ncbi:MAG: hypothetical protein A2Y14_04920 [Verrucomicrobia bacterium GWF2_51_19]|nr:MAG: hypothetical protein A2Y14_04920 [Verrucomicrobia bacterium GWF2_51_19]HCJ11953.1 hypothetical protein [Opitutae bacterium]